MMAENIDEKDSGMKWLLPLIIVVLMVIAGFWFCSKPAAVLPAANTNAPAANANTNAIK
jgi:hypothetical protein